MNKILCYLARTGKYAAVTSLVLCELLTLAPSAHAATRYEIGISTNATLLRMKDQDLDERLTNIEHLGATWIRVDFSWPAIQPDDRDVYQWEMYDRVVHAADVHHLKVLAILDYTPTWAEEPRCAKLVITEAAGHKCNPKNTDIFGRFARAAAIRYKNQNVRAWEIWNEPNLSSYWKTAHPDKTVLTDPASYAAFANAAAAQIRYNDPDSLIITGGLAPMFEPKYPKGLRQSDFLAQILPLLKPALFDGIGVHPYSWPALPGTRAIYNAFYTIDNGAPAYNLRTIMAKAGWGDKELWGTEYGASTHGVSGTVIPTPTSRPDHVTEALQALIIKQGIDQWYTKQNVGPLFVQSDSDRWLPDHKNEGGFGLKRDDDSKKPAYTAFQQGAQDIQNKAR